MEFTGLYSVGWSVEVEHKEYTSWCAIEWSVEVEHKDYTSWCAISGVLKWSTRNTLAGVLSVEC